MSCLFYVTLRSIYNRESLLSPDQTRETQTMQLNLITEATMTHRSERVLTSGILQISKPIVCLFIEIM